MHSVPAHIAGLLVDRGHPASAAATSRAQLAADGAPSAERGHWLNKWLKKEKKTL
jgi:hypothetical protein